MDMIRRALVALHPKDWRSRYGVEFAALLEDTRLSPSTVVNVIAHGAGLQVRAHRRAVLVVAAVALVSVTCEVIAHRFLQTPNVLWLPTDPLHALALLGTVGPWAVVLGSICARHRSARRA
jgi:hypothetical protein